MRQRTQSVVQAKEGGEYDLVMGFTTALGQENTAPETIQLFPPGKHTITARKGDKPITLDVNITEKVAQTIISDFRAIMAKSEKDGPKPFLDFNHEDREASAWVEDVFWAGEDPKTGGIRAKIAWTSSGQAAVQGRDFRQFSPNFRVSKHNGEIVGTTANMGGLVNRPAFKGIQPLFAKDADGNTEKQMNELFKRLVAAGLLSAIPTDDAVAAADFENKFIVFNAKNADLVKAKEDLTGTVTAKDAEIVAAKAAVTAAEERYNKLVETHAELVVAKAVSDGILAPKDEVAKATWLSTIKSNPDSSKLLATFNVSAKKADVTKTVIGDNQNQSQTGDSGDFLAMAKAIEVAEKCDTATSISLAAKRNPKAYDTYRENMFQPKQ